MTRRFARLVSSLRHDTICESGEGQTISSEFIYGTQSVLQRNDEEHFIDFHSLCLLQKEEQTCGDTCGDTGPCWPSKNIKTTEGVEWKTNKNSPIAPFFVLLSQMSNQALFLVGSFSCTDNFVVGNLVNASRHNPCFSGKYHLLRRVRLDGFVIGDCNCNGFRKVAEFNNLPPLKKVPSNIWVSSLFHKINSFNRLKVGIRSILKGKCRNNPPLLLGILWIYSHNGDSSSGSACLHIW